MPTRKLQSPKQRIITIEKPFGGWAAQKNQLGQTPVVPIEADSPDQYSLSSFIDLYRANFVGHIAPAAVLNTQVPDAAPIVNQLPVAAAALELNYAVLANNRVVQFNLSGVGQINKWDITSTLLNASTKHNGHSVQTANLKNKDIVCSVDMLVSPNLGYRFYTWEDQTDADIGIITQNVTGGAFTQTIDWFSQLAGTTLQAGIPLKLALGQDGNLYCTNGQYIAQAILVGSIFASAACNAKKLNLGNGWLSVSHTPYSSFHVFGGNMNTDNYSDSQFPRVRVWFWNYADPNPTYVFDLDDFFLDAVTVDPSGTLRAFTHGKDSLTRIWIYNGSSFQLETSYPTSTIPATGHNQVDYINDILHFLGSSNLSISQWTGKGLHNYGSYPQYADFGLLKNLDNIYIGINVGPGTYGLFTYNDSVPSITYAVNAIFRDQLRVLGYKGRVVAIRFYFSQFGTGAKFKASMYQGFDNATDLLNFQLTYTSGNNYNSISIPMNVILDSFHCDFLFNHVSPTAVAAILRKAEIVVEDTDFKL